MNKNGFTLIELLAIITIIGILSILIIPEVNNIINRNEDKIYDLQIKNIKESADNFILDYYDTFIDNNEYDSFSISLKLLKDLSYVGWDIKNPKTNRYFSDDTIISYTKNGFKYDINIFDFDSQNINDSSIYNDYIILVKNSNNFSSDNVKIINLDGTISDLSYEVLLDNNNELLIKEKETVKYNIIVQDYNVKQYSLYSILEN